MTGGKKEGDLPDDDSLVTVTEVERHRRMKRSSGHQ